MQSRLVASLSFPEGGSRQHFDDTGGDVARVVAQQVDVTEAGWQVQSTYFCAPPERASLVNFSHTAPSPTGYRMREARILGTVVLNDGISPNRLETAVGVRI